MQHTRLITRTLGSSAVCLLLGLAAGCGDSSKNTPSATPTAAEHLHASNPNDAAAIPLVTITAHDFAFEAPDSIAAGLARLQLNNAGHEDHQALLVRPNDGVSDEAFLALLQEDDINELLSRVTFDGGPTVVMAGGSAEVVQNLQAGHYFLVCVISGEDGVPHFAKGMVKAIDITGPAAATASFPPSQATITLRDFSFDGPATLSAGKTTVQLSNQGSQPHEAGVFRLDGISIEQFKTMLAAPPDEGSTPEAGPPPFSSVGGIGPLVPGGTGQMILDLTPGEYALLCFVPDPASGHAHAELGMVSGFTVQ